MIVVSPVLAVRIVLGRFLQMKFQSVHHTDRVEPFPRLAEREAHLLIVRDRALKIVDKELWSEGCHTRLHRTRSHRASFFSRLTVELTQLAIERECITIQVVESKLTRPPGGIAD